MKLAGLIHQLLNSRVNRELCNALDDWLESTRATSHPTGYMCGLPREVKNLVNKASSNHGRIIKWT